MKLDRIEKEFVLNSIIEKKIPIKIHGKGIDIQGYLKGYDDNHLFIETDFEDVGALGFHTDEDLRMFFFFFNKAHTFNTRISSFNNKIINLQQPPGLYKSLQRKHERISDPENIKVFILLKDQKIECTFPLVKQNGRPLMEAEDVSESIKNKDIKDFINEFKLNMKDKCSDCRIIMIRNKNIDNYEEKLLQKYAKSLWLPSTRDDFPVKDPFNTGMIILKAELIAYEKEIEIPAPMIKSRLSNILYKKQKSGIFSEIYMPIIYKNFFVGYIYVYNDNQMEKKIDKEMIEYLYSISKTISQILENNGYFEDSKKTTISKDAKIIDISASGILLNIPDRELSQKILVHSDLSIIIILKKRKLFVSARVIRKIKYNSDLIIALQYMEIKPEDYRYLYETIYGKPLTEEHDSFWEGGAPPPELLLD